MTNTTFSIDTLKLDYAEETEKITKVLREAVLKRFKKKGVVVACSGGIDSSLVGALCVRAFGNVTISKYKRFMKILQPFWMR